MKNNQSPTLLDDILFEAWLLLYFRPVLVYGAVAIAGAVVVAAILV